MANASGGGSTVKRVLSKYTTYFILLALFLLLGILTGFDAWRLGSLQNLVIAESIRAFAALGVGVIIITRGIDLSIGYAVCLTASIAASLSQSVAYEAAMYPGVNFPVFLPIIAAVAVGMLVGAVNGSLVAYAKLPPFIATLGVYSLCRGAQLIYTNATVVGSVKNEYKAIAQGFLGPFPYLMIYVAIAAVVVWVILRHTRLGANLYAIGGDPQRRPLASGQASSASAGRARCRHQRRKGPFVCLHICGRPLWHCGRAADKPLRACKLPHGRRHGA